ncbi:TetR/AcrR family transcriptional regulator [Flavobacteriaceae bacterium F89]|uniref:TetR/AcrR family transcriptional regulator n=1 Tax=Cerina litoralis TaxID=2874477 RepID=A0AAE3ETB7_9FLAO|nr:TetR/AcrR family transcriptional regulator [Cerina litoralis]MCG2459187.1 TetR/AcrR family transcriptional regulator [Cerina litoralis]
MKEKITEKATEMFLNLGFKSVTMDDLAQEMGMSKKTIYSLFENKTKLVDECTQYLFKSITDGIDRIIALGKNPIEEQFEIKKFIAQHLKDEKSSPQYQLQKYYPKIYKTLHRQEYDTMLHCVTSNLERGISQGIYRKNLDVPFTARIYFSGMSSIKNRGLFPHELFPKSTLADIYLEYHIRGIATEKGQQILNRIINSKQQ